MGLGGRGVCALLADLIRVRVLLRAILQKKFTDLLLPQLNFLNLVGHNGPLPLRFDLPLLEGVQFSLIGDTVNTTSRVCTTGDPQTITISDKAYAMV